MSYYCFTDTPETIPNPWKAVRVGTEGLGPKDFNRFAKMLPHQFAALRELDASLYVDASVILGFGVRDFIQKQLEREGDIFMFLHPYRTTVFAEGVKVCEGGHEWPLPVARQLRDYSRRGFTDRTPLFAGGVILRRHTPRTRVLMDKWWLEYQKGARRDQLSLGFAIEETGVRVESMGPMPLKDGNEQFFFKKHAARKPPAAHLKRALGLAIGSCGAYPLLFGRTAPPDVVHPFRQLLARFALSRSQARSTTTGQSADE